MKILNCFILLLPIVLFSAENKTIESQPQILFEHEKLQNKQEKRELLLKFNTAVLYLEQEKYLHAIKLLKQSSKILKVPSYLNIGIAYYKLKSNNNAYLYLKKIYDFKELQFNDRYSYFSAAYYLYKITNNEEYIKEITKVSDKAKRLTEQEKLLVVDTLILQKKYKKALKIAEEIKNISKIKVALLCIKLRHYSKAKLYLEKAFHLAKGDTSKNEVLWLQLYRNIKDNDIVNITENILKIEERKKYFHTQKKLELELFFNKDKYTAKEYFDKITNPSFDLKLSFAYYFAPFIFEDYDVMNVNETNGFIIKDKNSVNELNTMIDYNSKFLKVAKNDPIKRTQTLQMMIDEKYDAKAYEYYNLGLSYAQIFDYNNAYKYFKKAYNLDHGNKLYSVMTLMTTKKFNVNEDRVFLEFLEKNILSNKGTYNYLAKYMYKVFINSSIKLDNKDLSNKQKKSIFFRALHFIENIKSNGIMKNSPLLVEYDKDPLVHLFNLIAKESNENEYLYISRIQDELPKIYNNIFLKGSLIITDYYISTLKALGIFNRTDFNIDDSKSPSYLRTKAIIQLYNGKPEETITIIEYLHNEFNLQSIDSYYILIAALFSSGKDELAYATLTEIEFLYRDKDAKFLSGIRLLQDMKLNSAPQYFRDKLIGKLIDIRLKNFDLFLEEL
jgi:tetratricopeptide (TPR) repeat protein